MKKGDKLTVFNSDYLEMDTKELYEEALQDERIDEDVAFGSPEWYEYLADEVRVWQEDERMNLDIQTQGEIIAIADIGRWNGRVHGYTEVGHNVNSCLDSHVKGMSELEVYVEGTELQATESHHDGTNYYTFRELKEDAFSEEELDEFKDMLYDGTATQADIDRYTEPMGHYPAEIYGWKLQVAEAKETIERD